MNPVEWFRVRYRAWKARRWLRDWYHDEGMLAIKGCPHCEEEGDTDV